MGLDKDLERVFNRSMGLKLLLAKFGLGSPPEGGFSEGDVRIKRISPMTRERMRFEDEAKAQFQALKRKGLSIPVFTL
jgi:hypothetical protein